MQSHEIYTHTFVKLNLNNLCYMWCKNCLLFRSTQDHSRFQWGLFCSVLNFLYKILQIVVCFSFLLAIVLSLLPFTASDYPFVIFWPLYCLSFHLQLLVTPLISFGHCIVSPSIYSFRLPFGIFWSLYSQYFFDLPLLITLWYLLVIVQSVLL